jgi:cellulose synthase operon protein C
LASAYARQHDYAQALAVYRSWGMAGAGAADFRSAAGAALAADNRTLADDFLREGRARFPEDPGLLNMTAGQSISQGNFDEAEHFLRRALAATTNPPGAVTQGETHPVVSGFSRTGEPPRSAIEESKVSGPPAVNACRDVPAITADAATANQADVVASGGTPAGPPRDAPQVRAEQIQDEIDLLAHRNTPFIGIGGPVTNRAGDPGINRLLAADGAATGSIAIGNSVRVTAEAHAVSLFSGVPDGRSGYRFGTLPLGAKFREQSAAGLGGELQVSGNGAGFTLGLSPRGFPIQTWTGGLRLGAADGPVMLMAVRDNVRDSLLSYAGAMDPGSGAVWGGVVSNSVALHLKHDASASGQYFIGSAGLLRGQNVADNWNVQGILGAYWRVVSVGQGGLSVGLNAVGMHYDRNLNFFSLGHGGYFSPQRYLLGSIPISWFGRHRRVEYEISGSGGVQDIQEHASPYYPTLLSSTPSYYLGSEREGLNYSAAARVDYRIGGHFSLGMFASANNARDYDSRSIGVSLKLLTNRLPATTGFRLKAVPDWRGRQPYMF